MIEHWRSRRVQREAGARAGKQGLRLADQPENFGIVLIPIADLRRRNGRRPGGRVERDARTVGDLIHGLVEDALAVVGAQVIVIVAGEISTERVYGLTSLAPHQLDLAKLLQRWRGHWAIENRLHWVKDVVLKEDASRVRAGQSPFMLAMLRNALVTCLRAAGFDSITQGRRHLALTLNEAIACVCGLSE